MNDVYSTSQCSQVFPGGLNITSTHGNIVFNGCLYIQNNPSTQLVTPSIVANDEGCSPPSCYTAPCTASGGTAAQLSLPNFPTISGSNVTVHSGASATIDGNGNKTTSYGSVTLSENSTLNFSAKSGGSTLYKINTLTLNGDGNVVNFQPGDYWIKNFNANGNTTFNVVGTGTARLYFQTFAANGAQSWNYAASSVNSNPTANQLLIVSYGALTFNDVANINGLIYANGAVVFNDAGTINGAVSGQYITFNGATNIQYNASAVNNLTFGSLCGANSASQFNVSAPSTGTNCQNMTVTVTALNSSNQTVTSYNGAITISTQTGSGTWVSTTGKGTFSGGSSGVATYQFSTADNGVVSFQLSYPSSGTSPVTVKAYQTNSSNISGLSGPISFIPSGILVTGVAVQNPPAAPPAVFSTPQTSGNNFTLYLTAYNSGCGIINSYTGAKNIRFWTNYVNPTSGTMNATINGASIANSASATHTVQSITFTNGAATVTGQYTDVGQLSLNVQDTATGGPSGASGNFVVMPAQFAMNIPGNSASQTTSPASAAQTACLADSIFSKAGQPFTVNVQPQNSLGQVTPNYGNETPSQGITLQSSALVAPTGGLNGSNNSGTIGNASAFTKVTGSAGPFATAPYFTGATFTFDEVGCINLTAGVSGGSYLGAGNVTSSMVVGRFQPDHFNVTGNTPQFATGCGSGQFTYLDQPFVYATAPVLTVTAKAANNPVSNNYTTQNYNSSFKKISPSQFPASAQNYQSGASSTPSIDTSVANLPLPTETNNGAGTMTYTFAASGGSANQGLRLNRPAVGSTPNSPLTANIQLRLTVADTDTTPVVYPSNPFIFGSSSGIAFNNGASFYHGRLFVQNAYGSEIANLQVPMTVQYYNGSQFVNNTLDGCTQISNAANILLTDPPSPQTGVSTTASLPQSSFINGASYILLSAPNASGQKNVEVSLGSSGANLPWLQFNWPFFGGTAYEDPQAQANFGVYQGDPKMIYQQENYP